jgi:hypothetical protein
MSNDQKEQVFTIRIKLLEDAKAKWQGYIIAPPEDNEKHYFSDLLKLDVYIVSRLIKMGVQVSRHWKIAKQLYELKEKSQTDKSKHEHK